jgi:hypothetical protein
MEYTQPKELWHTRAVHIVDESFSEGSVCCLLFIYSHNMPRTIYQLGYLKFLVHTWQKFLIIKNQLKSCLIQRDVWLGSSHALICNKSFYTVRIPQKKILIPFLCSYRTPPLKFPSPTRSFVHWHTVLLPLSCSWSTLFTSSSSHKSVRFVSINLPLPANTA